MKAQHYQEIMEHEEEVWDVVQSKVCHFLKLSNIHLSPTAQICLTVRSTMDVFDRFTAKA